MHQLVLLTALSATTGIYGGSRCQGGQCGAPAPAYAPAPVYSYQSQYRAPGYHPQAAPAPVAAAPRAYQAAPVAQQVARPAAPYNVASYYYAPSSCAGGNCYRR